MTDRSIFRRLQATIAIVLVVAAAVLLTLRPDGQQPSPPPNKWDRRMEAAREDTARQSDLLRAINEATDVLADEPAGETYLMRRRGLLVDVADQLGYYDLRWSMIAAEFLVTAEEKVAALEALRSQANTPLVAHRIDIEIATTILRSGDQSLYLRAREAAQSAAARSSTLAVGAIGDVELLLAELDIAAGDPVSALRHTNAAIGDDPAMLNAHLQRLTLVDRVISMKLARNTAAIIEYGLTSADFVRLLSDRTYLIDTVDLWLPQSGTGWAGQFLRIYLLALAHVHHHSLAEVSAFIAKCRAAPNACPTELLVKAQELQALTQEIVAKGAS